jgi:ATP-dependent Clp protease adapter protein ClpS
MNKILNMGQLKPGIERENEVLIEVTTQEPAKVILFNDELHTFDEVINQIMKATGCQLTRAEELTWEVHNNGRAVIYEGEFIRCISVSGVLEEIQLATRIEV